MFDWTIPPTLTTQEKAQQLGVTGAALRNLRNRDEPAGPACVKYSAKVFRYWNDGRTMEQMKAAQAKADAA